MKLRIAIIVALVLLVLSSLGGMSQAAPPPATHLAAKDNGREVDLRGQQLVLRLESNPSTGYGWYIEELDESILRLAGPPEWVPSVPGLLGAEGTQVLRFVGVRRGQTGLKLRYRRPWEDAPADKGLAAEKSLALTVRVLETTPHASEVRPVAPGRAPTYPATDFLSGPPSSFSWCEQGACPPVRNQGGCGSCWAFGTVGLLESAILIRDGVSRDLSEQYLVSCNTSGWGCNGGWWAHDYHAWRVPAGEPAAGAVYEGAFPYIASDASCNPPHEHHERIADWAYVGNSSVPSVDAIKQAILQYGPVAAAVCVDSAFQQYRGGVFQGSATCQGVNHAIVLVGWDDADGAWILRNSWGPNWGENGYMRIAYGASLVGYAANYVVYEGAAPAPTPQPTAEPTATLTPQPTDEPTPTPTSQPTAEPTPEPTPTSTMHVAAIDMWYDRSGKNYFVNTRVTIGDAQERPVAGATVVVRTTLPDGSTKHSLGITGSDGVVTLKLKTKKAGTCTSVVTDVTHASYVYDPSANAESSEVLAVGK